MKLRKSFWARTILATTLFVLSVLLVSCATNNISVPVPGQGQIKTQNIYAEYYTLGDSYFKLEDYKKASEYYELAMKKKEQYWAAYYKLAKCYVYQSKWGDAQTAYETMLKRDPDNNSIKSSIAYIYAMTGNTDKSLEMYSGLIANTTLSVKALSNK